MSKPREDSPPRWADRLLEWFCRPHLLEEVQGDMRELYGRWVKQKGVTKARRLYILHTFKFVRPFVLKRQIRSHPVNATIMINDYFKIGWRHVERNKATTLVNVLGLTLGISCAILIFTLVTHHISFDTFHSNASRIYRIVAEFRYEPTEYQPGVPQPLRKAFLHDFSFAEKVARVRSYHSVMVTLPGDKEVKKFQEENMVAFAEPVFFDIFSFPLAEGNGGTVLKEPNTALITQKMAKKYFGTDHAIGKILSVTSLDKQADFRISGVLKDIPVNTDRKEQIYLSYENLKDYNAYYASDANWGSVSSGMHCFVLLKPGVTKTDVDKAFPSFVKKYYDEEDAKVTFFRLQPLADVHFNPLFGGVINKKYLWALALTGYLLILTACVNYVNLSTAQAYNRSKEVGIRKVLGSLRSHLFLQFMAETVLSTGFATILAYLLATLALPHINTLFKEQLTIGLFDHWQLPVFIILITLATVLLAGSYPGLMLSKFQPVLALKGKLSPKESGGFSLRRTLIIAQFAIFQMLIIGILVIAPTMTYLKTSDLGFDKEAIVMLPVPISDKTKMNTLRSRLAELTGVDKATLCYEAPASSANSLTSVRFDNHIKDEPWEINLKDADDQYASVFGLKLVAGRNLPPADTARGFLVNETFVKKLGLTSAEDVLGKGLSVNGGKINSTITGVLKDFYNNSFRETISPVCVMVNYDRFRNCAIRLNMNNASSAIESFGKIWNETYPDHVFSYQFLDDRIAKFYELDTMMLKLVEGFATIAILIGCLGLYGLVSFMALRKTKEIGVRKVLGASSGNILWLFAKEFTFLIIIAFALAAPVAWLIMDKWLQDFAYRIQMSPLSFLLAISYTFIVATLTVGYHSLKSAMANPVQSLRTE